jgi:integrase
MAKRVEKKLSDVEVKQAKAAGLLNDGGGLYLKVTKTGSRSWLFRYRFGAARRDMGLGKYPGTSLKEARDKAAEARKQVEDGIDPIEASRTKKAETKTAAKAKADVKAESFRRVAEDCHAVLRKKEKWRNEKHAAQWLTSLARYVFPIIGDMHIADITREDILRVLRPIWEDKTETASRVHGRIEAVISYAADEELREGKNLATQEWLAGKGLAARDYDLDVEHFAAPSWHKLPAFMAELRAEDSIAARALELTILTAQRTNAVLVAKWDEVDFEDGIWTIPATRLKKLKENLRVPLIDDIRKLLTALPRVEGNPFIFAGIQSGRPIHTNAMLHMLLELRPGLTVHGFRSTFRNWAAEAGNFDWSVVKLSMAQRIARSRADKAYLRTDLLNKRRELLKAWAEFCRSGQTDELAVAA